MEAVEAEVIVSLIHPYRRAMLKNFPIIRFTSRKLFLTFQITSRRKLTCNGRICSAWFIRREYYQHYHNWSRRYLCTRVGRFSWTFVTSFSIAFCWLPFQISCDFICNFSLVAIYIPFDIDVIAFFKFNKSGQMFY